jgi:hypothetical protein
MQGWSRMAALTLVAASTFVATVSSRETLAGDEPAKAQPTAQGKVNVKLVISGLKASDFEVEVKPGNGACSFKTQTTKIAGNAESYVEVKLNALDVITTSADRECSLAITIKEAGQVDRFARRGFRLSSSPSTKAQAMTYYLNSTALASKTIDTDRKVK